jgi:hypothetical protein
MYAWWPCLALSRMSSGCSGSLLGDMATRCALVQVRAVAGPRWGPASSAKMLESLNVLEYLCGCAPFFSQDMCAPFASSRADRATVGPAKQASKLLLTCLLACLDPLLEVGRNNFEIPRGNFCIEAKAESREPEKKGLSSQPPSLGSTTCSACRRSFAPLEVRRRFGVASRGRLRSPRRRCHRS